jgi:hypothetical protein
MSVTSTVFSTKSLILALAVLFIVAVILVHEVFQPIPSPAETMDKLNDLESKSLDTVIEMNKLIISLALIVLGACAAILVQKYPVLRLKTTFTTAILLTCVLFAASSIFSGYVLYDNLVTMLTKGSYFDPSNELIAWPQRLQFYSFFISVVLFGLFIISFFLYGEVKSDSSSEKPLLVEVVNFENDQSSKKGS